MLLCPRYQCHSCLFTWLFPCCNDQNCCVTGLSHCLAWSMHTAARSWVTCEWLQPAGGWPAQNWPRNPKGAHTASITLTLPSPLPHHHLLDPQAHSRAGALRYCHCPAPPSQPKTLLDFDQSSSACSTALQTTQGEPLVSSTTIWPRTWTAQWNR